MYPEFDLLINLASIAGIFIGFGALLTASDSKDEASIYLLRGVVSVGLVTLVGGLIPILLGKYGINEELIWRLSAGFYLSLIWFSLLHPQTRKVLKTQFRIDRKTALFFWGIVEPPIQIPLILSIIGILPSLHSAFFITSIILNLVQAGILLVQIVYSKKIKL